MPLKLLETSFQLLDLLYLCLDGASSQAAKYEEEMRNKKVEKYKIILDG